MKAHSIKSNFEERFLVKGNSFWAGFLSFFGFEQPYQKTIEKIQSTSASDAMLADIEAMRSHRRELTAKLSGLWGQPTSTEILHVTGGSGSES